MRQQKMNPGFKFPGSPENHAVASRTLEIFQGYVMVDTEETTLPCDSASSLVNPDPKALLKSPTTSIRSIIII